MFTVQNFEDNGCGSYDVDLIKDLVAVTWFVRAINNLNYIPGVTMGLDVYRTCQSSEMAAISAANILEKYRVLKEPSAYVGSPSPLLGVLGPDTTETAMTVSQILGFMPEQRRLVQISGTATGEALSDKTAYPNFFRVIPPDSTQVGVLAELLVELKWNYVAIVFSDDEYGRQAADRLRSLAHDRDICVPVFGALPPDTRDTKFVNAVNNIRDQIDGGERSLVKGVVFIGVAHAAQKFVDLLKNQVSFARFVFSEAIGLQSSALTVSDNQPYGITKGALAASPPYLPFPEFESYWRTLWQNRTVFMAEAVKNPWLSAFYTEKTNCPISDDQCWASSRDSIQLLGSTDQWLFQYYHVKAVAFFAVVLKQLHQDQCGQTPGLCDNLVKLLRNDRAQIQDTLQSLTVTGDDFSSVTSAFDGQVFSGFDEQGDVSNTHSSSLYDVYNYRQCQGDDFCFRQVGSMSANGTLSLKTAEIEGYDNSGSPLQWPNFPTSQCQDGFDCLECVPENLPGQVVFVPGDFYLVAVVAVHDKDSVDALQCGPMRNLSSADLVQSVLFAVEQVNSKNRIFADIFGDKTLGVVILDSCYRELVIKERLIALHSGNLELPDGRKSSAILPYIAGYVGGYFSTISVAMYEVLSKLEKRFVMVGPTSTSPVLSDRTEFPYYLRVSTSTHTLVKAMLSLVRDLDSHYVQVIYDPGDVYSSSMKTALDDLSGAYNVCIAQSIGSIYEQKDKYSILDEMRKTSSASIVILALAAEHITELLNDILVTWDFSDNFVFLGSEDWGRREQVLEVQGRTKLIGSLTFSQELPLDSRFDDYFAKVDPLNTPNPWLKYFWEIRKNCYFDGSFLREGKVGKCPSDPRDLTSDFSQDPWTPFYIDAVYAFALGLDAAIKQHCGSQANYLCDELTSEKLASTMKTVKLDLYNGGEAVSVFDKNGDGTLGFKVFQVSRGSSADAVVYQKVGRYEYSKLTLNNRGNLWVVRNDVKAVCPNQVTCNKCFPSQAPNTTNAQVTGGDDDPTGFIAGIVVLVIFVIVLAVLLIVVLIICRRQRSRSQAVDEQGLTVSHSTIGGADFGSNGLHTGSRGWQEEGFVPTAQRLSAGDLRHIRSSPADLPTDHYDNPKYGSSSGSSGGMKNLSSGGSSGGMRKPSDPAFRPMPSIPVSESSPGSKRSEGDSGFQTIPEMVGSNGYVPRTSAGHSAGPRNVAITGHSAGPRNAGITGEAGHGQQHMPTDGYMLRDSAGTASPPVSTNWYVPRDNADSPNPSTGGRHEAQRVNGLPRQRSPARSSSNSRPGYYLGEESDGSVFLPSRPDDKPEDPYDCLTHDHCGDPSSRSKASYTGLQNPAGDPQHFGGSADGSSGGSGSAVASYKNQPRPGGTVPEIPAVGGNVSDPGSIKSLEFVNGRPTDFASQPSSGDSVPPVPSVPPPSFLLPSPSHTLPSTVPPPASPLPPPPEPHSWKHSDYLTHAFTGSTSDTRVSADLPDYLTSTAASVSQV